MNRWKLTGCVLLLSLLALTVCAGAAEPLVVTEEQNGGSVTLEQGQHMTLTLPGNPTTGYQWTVPNSIEAYLTLHDSSYTPGSDRIGAPGHYTFHFEAQNEGTVNLEMAYARGWETKEPEDTFSLEVTIVHRSPAEGTEEEAPEEPEHPTDPYPAIPE